MAKGEKRKKMLAEKKAKKREQGNGKYRPTSPFRVTETVATEEAA